ncbi:MAG: hypothetical protein NC489_13725 [Ruminococcus flavefaciens]|nr:hypothetical protein [Ruminococcus flavefaciens]
MIKSCMANINDLSFCGNCRYFQPIDKSGEPRTDLINVSYGKCTCKSGVNYGKDKVFSMDMSCRLKCHKRKPQPGDNLIIR